MEGNVSVGSVVWQHVGGCGCAGVAQPFGRGGEEGEREKRKGSPCGVTGGTDFLHFSASRRPPLPSEAHVSLRLLG